MYAACWTQIRITHSEARFPREAIIIDTSHVLCTPHSVQSEPRGTTEIGGVWFSKEKWQPSMHDPTPSRTKLLGTLDCFCRVVKGFCDRTWYVGTEHCSWRRFQLDRLARGEWLAAWAASVRVTRQCHRNSRSLKSGTRRVKEDLFTDEVAVDDAQSLSPLWTYITSVLHIHIPRREDAGVDILILFIHNVPSARNGLSQKCLTDW